MLAMVVLTAVGVCFAQTETVDQIHYRLGMKYKNENKLDEALDEFLKVLAAYPDNYNTYMQIAEIRIKQGNFKLAEYNLKKALSYNPGWSKAHKLMANAYEQQGQYEKAITEWQHYQQACDPAERDSVQAQINRLLRGSSPTQVAESSAAKPAALVDPKTPAATTPAAGAKSAASKASSTTKTSSRPLPSVQPVPSKTPQIEAAFQKVVQLYNNRNYDAAHDAIRQVLALQPGHPGAYYYGGLIRRRSGDNEKALFNFSKAIAYPDLGYNAHFYIAKIYAEQKNYKGAIENLEAYIERTTYEPGEREARSLIGQYRQLLEQANKPAVKEEKKIDLPLDLEIERKVESVTYKPFEISVDSLLSMVILDTVSDAGQRMLKGVHAFRQDRFDEAITQFKQLMVAMPTADVMVHSLYDVGICYLRLRLFKDAENQFQQVLDRYPNHPLAQKSLFFKALSYLERKDGARAEQLFRQFIQQNRSHPWIGSAYEQLGEAYLEQENPKMAIDAFTQAAVLATTPKARVLARFKLGNAYAAIDNEKRALASFEQVIEAGEKEGVSLRVPDAYYKIADYYYRLKDYKSALDYYKRVTRKYPNFQETPWGLFQIGNTFKQTANYQDAIAVYKDLQSRYPDDYWARQARWKMEDAIWEHEYKAVIH